jgi:hypothetical protein
MPVKENISFSFTDLSRQRFGNCQPLLRSRQKRADTNRPIRAYALLNSRRLLSSERLERLAYECGPSKHDGPMTLNAGPKPAVSVGRKRLLIMPRGIDDSLAAFAPPSSIRIIGDKPERLH